MIGRFVARKRRPSSFQPRLRPPTKYSCFSVPPTEVISTVRGTRKLLRSRILSQPPGDSDATSVRSSAKVTVPSTSTSNRTPFSLQLVREWPNETEKPPAGGAGGAGGASGAGGAGGSGGAGGGGGGSPGEAGGGGRGRGRGRGGGAAGAGGRVVWAGWAARVVRAVRVVLAAAAAEPRRPLPSRRQQFPSRLPQ